MMIDSGPSPSATPTRSSAPSRPSSTPAPTSSPSACCRRRCHRDLPGGGRDLRQARPAAVRQGPRPHDDPPASGPDRHLSAARPPPQAAWRRQRREERLVGHVEAAHERRPQPLGVVVADRHLRRVGGNGGALALHVPRRAHQLRAPRAPHLPHQTAGALELPDRIGEHAHGATGDGAVRGAGQGGVIGVGIGVGGDDDVRRPQRRHDVGDGIHQDLARSVELGIDEAEPGDVAPGQAEHRAGRCPAPAAAGRSPPPGRPVATCSRR